jgi:hypothetical protein
MNKRANLLKHVKGVSGWRYYPVVWLRNGSVRPNHVLVNGKAEHHQEGFYSIEWYEQGRRRRQAVGKEASEAQAADRHLHRLRGLALGLKAGQEAQEPNRSLVEACREFLDLYRPSASRKVKTYQAYRVALENFQESCPKRFLEEIDRRDLQHFTWFLINKKEHDPGQPTTNWRWSPSSSRRTTFPGYSRRAIGPATWNESPKYTSLRNWKGFLLHAISAIVFSLNFFS